MMNSYIFNSTDLLPAQWHSMKNDPLWAFNPGLLKYETGWIFAYRMVGIDGLRRIALCRLDSEFQIVQGSQVPFSDLIIPKQENTATFRRWFADPRLYHFNGKMFIYWNSGWHEPQNFQYLQAFDPQTLMPIGFPREMLLQGQRQPLEKNWTLFENSSIFYAIYSVNPHRILTFSLTESNDDIIFEDVISHPWNTEAYSAHYGQLRGGAPPVLVDDKYYNFCHSLYYIGQALHYAVSVYVFSAHAPFLPLIAPLKILELPNPLGTDTRLPRLNTAVTQVNYPCGAQFEDNNFIISYGINDELCMISVIPYDNVTTVLNNQSHHE